jgi:hypothetical protein
VKPQLSQHLMQQNVMKNVEALKAKAKIEVVGAAAPAPAAPAAAAAPAAPAAPATPAAPAAPAAK